MANKYIIIYSKVQFKYKITIRVTVRHKNLDKNGESYKVAVCDFLHSKANDAHCVLTQCFSKWLFNHGKSI